MTETILFVCLFLFSSLSIPYFSFCLARPFPLFYFILCSILNTHIRSGCLAYFSFFVVLIIFDLHYIHPTICVFLSNNLWSFCCLRGTFYIVFFSPSFFFLYFIFALFSPPEEFVYLCVVPSGMERLDLFDLRSSRRESPPLCTHHPHCLRMIFPIYLQSLIWIDPISQGLYYIAPLSS